MSGRSFVFTSESVSEGHPDKVCDRISDDLLDAFLERRSDACVAIEALATTNLVVLAGEVRPCGLLNERQMEQVARDAVRHIGYEQNGFHWNDLEVRVCVHEQSPDIARGVDGGNGAGDQGIMFGYACRETDAYMPAAIAYAHRILAELGRLRKAGDLPGLGPDGKSQISLRYEDGKPVRAEAVVVSSQHDVSLNRADVREMVRPVVERVLPDGWMCPDKAFYVNPAGDFVIGGPDGDAGLTGRKIIVDTYGGAAPHGGGAFSGKDPTKLDRSAAYAARYLAKNVVAADLADRCTIQISYAIGVPEPLSFHVDTHGTGRTNEETLSRVLREAMDLSPRGLREHLNLARPIYAPTSAYGHFGRTPDDGGGFTWERTDLVPFLKGAF